MKCPHKMWKPNVCEHIPVECYRLSVSEYSLSVQMLNLGGKKDCDTIFLNCVKHQKL